jgi:hypothetical protein
MYEKSRPCIWKPALRCALWITISILGVACVTTEKTEITPQKTHFVLEPGPVERGQDPLPDLTPIYVRIYAGDQLIERRLGYKAWDFNRDGSIDMLEYLDSQGQVIRRSYDLNRDGVVDLEKR